MKFSRGYSEVRENVAHSPRYTRSCSNCAYFSQEFGDKEEVCQNDEVTEYDVVVDGYNMYCSFWRQVKSTDKDLFSKPKSHRSGRYNLF